MASSLPPPSLISALVFLQSRSVWNRLLFRLRRLKQPKYLVAAVIGGAYFWFYILRFLMFPAGARHGVPGGVTGPMAFNLPVELLEGLAATVLFAILLSSWIFPHERSALIFSEAEIAFLFPAPVSRRGLIHYKLARSQLAILFTTMLLTLISGRWRFGVSQAMISVLGWWLVLSTLSLHFMGASFARTLLLDRGIGNWTRRILVLALTGALIGGLIWWAKGAVRFPTESDVDGFQALSKYTNELLSTGPATWLLFPLRAVVRPWLSKDLLQFLIALGPALLVLAAHYLWVMRSNVAFEEASVAASEKMADTLRAVRAGKRASLKPMKAKRPPFRLAPTGFPPVAILWKNLISAGQAFSSRVWFIILWLVIVGGFMGKSIAGDGREPVLMVIGGLCLGLLAMSLFMGPAIARVDLRQDLQVADLLKVYPLRGWQVVLGELLAPTVILTSIQWLLIVAATLLFAPPKAEVTLGMRVGCGLALAILSPALNFVSLLIPNAAVVLLPGWMPRGKERAQGVEATGQQLILLLGQLVVLVVAVLPAALLALGILWLGTRVLPWAAVIPFAALVAALALAVESGVGVWFMGKLFERMDVSQELGQ